MSLQAIEFEVMALVNQHRRKIQKLSLKHHPEIWRIAAEHVENMANGTVAFGHYGFKRRVYLLENRLNIIHCGENVAFNNSATPAETAFQQWLNSPQHKQTLEKGIFTHTAVAVQKSEKGVYFYVQLFGRI